MGILLGLFDKCGKVFAYYLIGLQVETVYGPKKQRFTVSGITQENATQKRILIGEQELTVQQYFSDKYGITLEYLF